MSDFEERLKESRTHAGLSQPELAEKVGVDKSYISKLERGVESPPSRKVAVKLAEAVGMSNRPVTLYVSTKDRAAVERFVFLLEANVAGIEDVQAIGLINIDDSEAHDEERANSTTLPNTARPALELPDSLFDTTEEEIEEIKRLIASISPTAEEERMVKAVLLDTTKRLLSFIEAQRKMRKDS